MEEIGEIGKRWWREDIAPRAQSVEQWLGEDNKIGIDIWNKKYRYKDETFEEWLYRVSAGLNDVADMILNKEFLFGGRILATRGIDSDIKASYSNCYVIAPPEDNLESIYDTCKEMARTYSFGGGCGIDISKLAPDGATVHNQAKTSSGAVSFMDTFSQVTQQICQNGRRGALMISIDCTHPDLEKFIRIKTDLDKVNFANISVRVSDEFMKAVEEDLEWELFFERKETGEKISRTVKAKDIFRLLCETNWDYAEPGLLFWDRMTGGNLQSENDEFSYAGVNPCVVGETLISTTDGEIQIKDLVGKKPDVYCMDSNGDLVIKKASKVWMTRKNAKVVRIKTHRGTLTCTPDHMIHTRNRGWVRADDLKHGDKLTGLNRQMACEKHVAVGLTGGKYVREHRLVAEYYNGNIDGKDVHHIDGNTFNNTRSNLEVLEHGEHSALSNTGRKTDVIRDSLGRYMSKAVKKKKSSMNLGVCTGTNWFVDKVIQCDETFDVYDMTVPDVHNFIADRIVVHNCGEEPLPAYGACLLGSLNLAAFVRSDDDDTPYFDMERFRECIGIAVCILNDVQHEGTPKHPLGAQQKCADDWRQIGLGIMGLADALIKLRLVYGSEESIRFCDTIGWALTHYAIVESCNMTEFYGTYPKWSDKVFESAFFKDHMSEHDDAMEDIRAHKLANSQLLTIAPTGTLSTMLNISGGIEPVFANSYTRTTKTLHGDEDVTYKIFTPIVKRYMNENGITDEKDLPPWFITAPDIPVENRIRMQSVWQKHIDASISSTINLPNEATVDDIADLYMGAWKAGLKGVTVYRAGCARQGILVDDKSSGKKDSAAGVEKEEKLPVHIYKPVKNIGLERHLTTGCGSLHICAYFDEDGNLKNTYLSKGSAGGCNNFMIGLSRMISLSARNGVGIEDIVDQLNSCGTCPSYAVRRATKRDTSIGSCCPVAIGNALMDMWREVNEINNTVKESNEIAVPTYDKHGNPDGGFVRIVSDSGDGICPECGGELKHEMGCVTCMSCGYSKCG